MKTSVGSIRKPNGHLTEQGDPQRSQNDFYQIFTNFRKDLRKKLIYRSSVLTIFARNTVIPRPSYHELLLVAHGNLSGVLRSNLENNLDIK